VQRFRAFTTVFGPFGATARMSSLRAKAAVNRLSLLRIPRKDCSACDCLGNNELHQGRGIHVVPHRLASVAPQLLKGFKGPVRIGGLRTQSIDGGDPLLGPKDSKKAVPSFV
jgi:hypothetical protein